jgi:hypothetical protein
MAENLYDFTWENINKSPDQPGVYALYRDAEIVYIGQSESSIRSRLSDHKSGRSGTGIASSTQYWRETNSNPKAREAELLRWYKGDFGRLPRYNEVLPVAKF